MIKPNIKKLTYKTKTMTVTFNTKRVEILSRDETVSQDFPWNGIKFILAETEMMLWIS